MNEETDPFTVLPIGCSVTNRKKVSGSLTGDAGLPLVLRASASRVAVFRGSRTSSVATFNAASRRLGGLEEDLLEGLATPLDPVVAVLEDEA